MKNGWIEGRGYRKKLLADERLLRCPGTLVQLIEIAPHTSVPPHYHKTSLRYVNKLCFKKVNQAAASVCLIPLMNEIP